MESKLPGEACRSRQSLSFSGFWSMVRPHPSKKLSGKWSGSDRPIRLCIISGVVPSGARYGTHPKWMGFSLGKWGRSGLRMDWHFSSISVRWFEFIEICRTIHISLLRFDFSCFGGDDGRISFNLRLFLYRSKKGWANTILAKVDWTLSFLLQWWVRTWVVFVKCFEKDVNLWNSFSEPWLW